MKKFFIAILATCFIILCGNKTFAATTITEIEPNNSVSQAQTIQRNNEDYSSPINGYSGGNVVSGSIKDTTDQDWYKVYLPADSSTVLGINSEDLDGTGYFEVYDENLNLVSKTLNMKNFSILGATSHYVNIPKSGYYYIKVYSTSRVGNYIFFIGTPSYTVDRYTYTAQNPCILTPSINSVQAAYDLSSIESVPKEAVVYNISIDGIKTNYASDEERSIKLTSDYSWINIPKYVYSTNNVPVISKKYVRNKWSFKLEGDVSRYTGYYSLIPQITFDYVYPELPN